MTTVIQQKHSSATTMERPVSTTEILTTATEAPTVSVMEGSTSTMIMALVN